MEVHEKFALHQRFLMFYKKDTLALFFSFFFTFMLASALLVLMHTNHRTENTEYKTIFTPSDCLIRQLSPGQTDCATIRISVIWRWKRRMAPATTR